MIKWPKSDFKLTGIKSSFYLLLSDYDYKQFWQPSFISVFSLIYFVGYSQWLKMKSKKTKNAKKGIKKYDMPEFNPEFNPDVIPDSEIVGNEVFDLIDIVNINGQDLIIENDQYQKKEEVDEWLNKYFKQF